MEDLSFRLHISHYQKYQNQEPMSRLKDDRPGTSVIPLSGTTHGHRKRDAKVTPITKNELSEVKEEVKRCQSLLAEAQQKLLSADEDARNKEQQMAEVEGQNMELMDQIASLEQEIDALQRAPEMVTDWTETLKAKDQYTEYLEAQADTTQKQITTLKKKFKKRLRLLNTQLSEAKQGQSVQSFEQQQEHRRLTEENNKLQDQLRRQSKGGDKITEDFSDNRTKIILELSAKVSEQDSTITELELKLAENQRELDNLQTDSERLNVKVTTSDASVWSTNFGNHSTTDRERRVGSSLTTVLKSDDEMNTSTAMTDDVKRLQKKKVRKEADFRESSGVSRDSGIVTISNGNVEHPEKQVDSDWGDSDSDVEVKGDHLPSSAHSRTSANSEVSHQSDTEDNLHGTILDPYNIRQISAAKLRKGKKVHAGLKSQMNGKPPCYKGNFKYSTEVDSLINDLDSMGTKSKGPVPVS